jgi:tRNA pseudouridine55 synthase
VERPARKIEIRRLDAIEMEQLPSKAMLAVGCSKGTYIRTLCYDIGETLGCGAVMSALQRTRIGSFSLCDAYTLDEISAFETRQLQR